jgi:O-acetyl-ADP-ribose deacetylase (regulator of RNase III)
MFVSDSGRPGAHRYVINFPTKGHWRSRSRLADISPRLDDLARTIREHNIGSVALPALGCGNGGLDWAEVRPLIETTFAKLPDVRVLLYSPASA